MRGLLAGAGVLVLASTLVHDPAGTTTGSDYQLTGFVQAVNPQISDTHKGYLEIGRHYQNGNDPTVVRKAQDDTKQHWRVNFGTDEQCPQDQSREPKEEVTCTEWEDEDLDCGGYGHADSYKVGYHPHLG